MREDLRFFTYSFSKVELIIIAVLLSVTVILRFPQLGYSHFYGDETKAIFYNKSISITDFLLDQRKGPIQFVVTWVSENIVGGFNEKFIVYFLIPLIFITSVFYIPYVAKGYFSGKTQNYVVRRITGQEYRPSNSFYTIKVYNPDIFYLLLLVFSFFHFATASEQKSGVNFDKTVVFCWFLIPYFVFEFIFLNPGTHINNYLIPLYIMSGVGLVYFIDNYLILYKRQKTVLGGIVVVLLFSFIIKATVFIPYLNRGYPWKDQ